MRDALDSLSRKNVKVVGISPDAPGTQKKFAEKHALPFPLLSDDDHEVAEAFGVWAEKTVRGKTSLGIVRSAFLFDEDGRLLHAWYGISPKDTVPRLLEALK